MEYKTNIRGSISDMEVNEILSFTYIQTKPSYIRKIAYELGVDLGRVYSVKAKRGCDTITVTRIS